MANSEICEKKASVAVPSESRDFNRLNRFLNKRDAEHLYIASSEMRMGCEGLHEKVCAETGSGLQVFASHLGETRPRQGFIITAAQFMEMAHR